MSKVKKINRSILIYIILWIYFFYLLYGIEYPGFSGIGAYVLVILVASILTLVYLIYFLIRLFKYPLERKKNILILSIIILPSIIAIVVENLPESCKNSGGVEVIQLKNINLKN